jgi:hypothetical protein
VRTGASTPWAGSPPWSQPNRSAIRHCNDDEVDVDAEWEDAWGGSAPDGVAALHDVESEAGDEAEIRDLYDMDQREARELGVNLDMAGGQEPVLD